MLNDVDLSRADLNLLVLFETVLAERHVARASARLNLSPSAVSHGLRRLRRLLNDPVFLRHPKGMVPTARALELTEPIAEILRQIRSVLERSEPFNPASSRRQYVIGAPDGAAAVILAPLLAQVRSAGPGIQIAIRPLQRETVVAELDARRVDLALTPLENVPGRFHYRLLYEDPFLLAVRPDHPLTKEPSLRRYCEMQHLIVSVAGERRGLVDDVLAERGLSRHVAVAVPNAMLALDLISRSDLVAALPARLLKMHAAKFGVVSVEPPLVFPATEIRAIVPKVALADAGLTWLLGLAEKASTPVKNGASDGLASG